MSVSPAQNWAKPSPVPGPETDTATPGFRSAKASPAAIEIGSTVDEPETTMLPETSPPAGGLAAVGVDEPLGGVRAPRSSSVGGLGRWLAHPSRRGRSVVSAS